MNFFDSIYGTMFKPNSTFPKLGSRVYLLYALFIICIVSFILSSKIALGSNFIPITFSFTFIVISLFWVFTSLVLTLTSDVLGGSGRVTDTMVGLAYSMIPLMFFGPLSNLSYALGSEGALITLLFNISIYLWSLYLAIISLKHLHRFHETQAILSIMLIVGFILAFVVSTGCLSFLGAIILSQIV